MLLICLALVVAVVLTEQELTEVQVVEMADRPLPLEDEAISKELQRVYKKRGIPIHCSVKLESAEVGKMSVSLKGRDLLKDVEVSFEPEVVLTAVGRVPVLDDVGLDRFKVEMEGRFIKVDEFYRTRLSWLYAIGDIIPGPQLAHVASAEGIVCTEAITQTYMR